MYRILLVVAPLFLLAVPVQSQTRTVLQKCRTADGAFRFTNTGCKANEKLVDQRAYYNGPERDNSLQLAQERVEMDRRNREWRAQQNSVPSFYDPPAQPTERDKRKADCAAARKFAADARGKGYTSAVLSRFDKAAVDACFGL